MKSVRTTRPPVTQAHPAAEPAAASGPAGSPMGSAEHARKESRSASPGHGAGWRLPSGQLLIEYALQTCFTGSPFDRPPFQAGQEQGPDAEPGGQTGASAGAAEDTRVSQGLQRLQNAVERAGAPPQPSRRTPAARQESPTGKPVNGRERARS